MLSKQIAPMCTFNIFCLLDNLIFNLKILRVIKVTILSFSVQSSAIVIYSTCVMLLITEAEGAVLPR